MFFAVVNWIVIGLVIWKVDPETVKDFIIPGSYLPMTILMTGGVFWLLSILLLSSFRAWWWTLGIMTFLELRVLGLGSTIEGLLILGLLLCWEIYHLKIKPKEIKIEGV